LSEFRFKQKDKGFTLAEVLVVVVIIGILVAIAVPVYSNNTTQAKRTAVEANLRTIDSAISRYESDNEGAKPENADDLSAYLQTWPEGPDGVEYDVSDDGRAVISQVSTGEWFTTSDESLPITW